MVIVNMMVACSYNNTPVNIVTVFMRIKWCDKKRGVTQVYSTSTLFFICRMMAVPLKKLEDQLNCPICLDTYTNPKQLQCNYVYCQQCLVKLVIRDQQPQLSLPCPTCRQVTPVPASGVAGLQVAFHVNQLLEIVEEHKKATVVTAKVECF